MNRISLGFILAMLYNSGIVIFSKGFGSDLGAVDGLFSPGGCIGVLLWGLAYLALANRYSVAPAVALVFCLEKAFYGIHWCLWISRHSGEIPAMIEADFLTGAFFSCYGVGDLAFMVFFGLVAWRYRDNILGAPAE